MRVKDTYLNLIKLPDRNGPRVRIMELLTATKGSNEHGLCGRCSYQGCIWLTEKYGVLGHWIWTAQSIKRRVGEYLSLRRIYSNFVPPSLVDFDEGGDDERH